MTVDIRTVVPCAEVKVGCLSRALAWMHDNAERALRERMSWASTGKRTSSAARSSMN